VEALDGHVEENCSELGAEFRAFEGPRRGEGRLGSGPDGESEPSPVGVATERAAQESRLVVGELDLHTLVECPERRLVDARRQPKCQDLEHGVDATVR
jgi:hypothetical protein